MTPQPSHLFVSLNLVTASIGLIVRLVWFRRSVDNNSKLLVNLYLRILLTLLRMRRREPLGIDQPVITNHRVWPLDIDCFGHMNNGRYLQVMDLSRFAWMVRAGVLRAMRQQGWNALIGGVVIRYRRALKPLQSYRVETHLASWDDHWWYLQHRFVAQSERTIAIGAARCGLRCRGGWVPATEVLEILGPGMRPPLAPEYVETWMQTENALWSQGARPERRRHPRINVADLS